MRYEFWLGLRYLFAKRREKFISVIAVLAVGGVALGVAALLVVLAVMSGFDHDIKDKLVGTNAHLIVDAPQGIRESDELLRRLAAMEHVVGVSPYIAGQAILRLPDRAFGVLVRGIDVQRETQVSRLADYLVVGRLPKTDQEIILGTELAAVIQAGPGDTVSLISPADGSTQELTISGLFRSGMYEYDANLVAVTLERAQRLYRLDGRVSGVGVRLDALERAPAMQEAIRLALGPQYQVRTWMELNQTLFDALKLEKLVMFVILALIILVAAANIVSTLIMLVIEKTRDIGILKSIGATNRSIGALFTWEGLLIGTLGTAFGAALAWGIIWSLDTYQWIKLPSTVYYLDHLPVRVEGGDWWKTLAAAFVITLLSTVYPARQAARLAPVEALRYE
ncbi:MAG: ABC transporter permease [Candidatus Omnitrophica bacterium]|nr:ABC transporter permease [Candidatus Omnitrophota bacterium]